LGAKLAILSQRRRQFRSLASQLRTYAEIALLPTNAWGTKGFQFWTFLSLLLAKSNCLRILELGSGRSTITLAEYARFRPARFISIETSRRWFNKARFELRMLGVAEDSVHLVDWDSGKTWYEVKQFRETIGEVGNFDFAFIDGPNYTEGKSLGIRNSEVALAEIQRCIRQAEVVIVDDVHRIHIFDSVDPMLSEPNQYEKCFYNYWNIPRYMNTLCICVKKTSPISAELRSIQSLLDIPLYVSFKREDCPEE
jgi:predicted O-methyltransferase YrrM